MNLKTIASNIAKGAKKHAPELLTGAGVASFIIAIKTAYDSQPKVNMVLDQKTLEKGAPLTKKETVLLTIRTMAPTFILAGTGVATIVCARYLDKKVIDAAMGALAIANKKALSYERAIEAIDNSKIKDSIKEKAADELVDLDPPDDDNILNEHHSNEDRLFLDSMTGQYFWSTVNKVDAAVNDINEALIKGDSVTMNDFYDCIGSRELRHTELGRVHGWEARFDELLKVKYRAKTIDDGMYAGDTCRVLVYDIGYLN